MDVRADRQTHRSRPSPLATLTSRSTRPTASERASKHYSFDYAAQVRSSPQALTAFVVLNRDAPPFDHLEVRQALNLALDRDEVVAIFGGEGAGLPTCQQLPPNFPGYEPYCPYTKDPGAKDQAPGVARTSKSPEASPSLRARRGCGSRSTTRSLLTSGPARTGPRGLPRRPARSSSATTGVEAPSAERVLFSRYGFQLALDAWGLDYPAAVELHRQPVRLRRDVHPLGGFCDRKIDAMIERATQMQARDPTAAGALWANIDHSFVDQAPYVWLKNGVAVEFVSERVDNYPVEPSSGAAFSISSGFGSPPGPRVGSTRRSTRSQGADCTQRYSAVLQ